MFLIEVFSELDVKIRMKINFNVSNKVWNDVRRTVKNSLTSSFQICRLNLEETLYEFK
jgi:hypothetical protein